MYELFNDTFKYGFNFKVKVKFKVKYKKIVKKGKFHKCLLLLVKVYLNGKKSFIAQ